MKTTVRARPETVFWLAARVEEWPRLLPHYERVRVLHEDGRQRVVEMAARRDFLPVQWTAIETLDPEAGRITFRHIGGVTRGMDVAWTLTPAADGRVLVRIVHRFHPRWPFVSDWLVQRVVGAFFVDAIARKTLRRIADLAEAARA